MSSNGPNLGLIAEEVQGVNWYDEARRMLRGIDGLIQCSVLDKDLTAPPGSPADGDRYIVGASATGAWAGHDKAIARYSSVEAAWEFFTPNEGWAAYIRDEDKVYTYGGSTWAAPALPSASVSSQTANYVLILADAGTWIRMNVASANTLTVPPNSSVAFPVGTEVHVEQNGAGQTTIVAGAGVTVNTSETLKLATQYAVATLKKVGSDEWTLIGYLEAAP